MLASLKLPDGRWEGESRDRWKRPLSARGAVSSWTGAMAEEAEAIEEPASTDVALMEVLAMNLLDPAIALLAARFASFLRAALLPSIQHCRQTCRVCTCIVCNGVAFLCIAARTQTEGRRRSPRHNPRALSAREEGRWQRLPEAHNDVRGAATMLRSTCKLWCENTRKRRRNVFAAKPPSAQCAIDTGCLFRVLRLSEEKSPLSLTSHAARRLYRTQNANSVACTGTWMTAGPATVLASWVPFLSLVRTR